MCSFSILICLINSFHVIFCRVCTYFQLRCEIDILVFIVVEVLCSLVSWLVAPLFFDWFCFSPTLALLQLFVSPHDGHSCILHKWWKIENLTKLVVACMIGLSVECTKAKYLNTLRGVDKCLKCILFLGHFTAFLGRIACFIL